MSKLKSQEVIDQLLQLNDEGSRGTMIFHANNILKWKFNFRLGRLNWVAGGVNSHERLQRHLAFFCPEIKQTKLQQIVSAYQPEREQEILVQLQREKLIERQKIAALMTSIAIEIIFDVLQYSKTNTGGLSFEKVAEESNNKLNLLLPLLEIEPLLTKASQAWQKWQDAGLTKYCPNIYPVIKQPDFLQEQIKAETERQILSLVDGMHSIRSISFKCKVDTLGLTRFLLKLANLGVIKFSSTSCMDGVECQFIPSVSNSNQDTSPLVVCVDDSLLICQALEKIMARQGYRFISIQEPIKVIPILLKNKPDFIFLDLLMPVVNGYELCAQIRRTPSLKDIPIVILTGNDGLVDRMRAKLVGSTDFISKPVEVNQVLSMLDKHLIVRR